MRTQVLQVTSDSMAVECILTSVAWVPSFGIPEAASHASVRAVVRVPAVSLSWALMNIVLIPRSAKLRLVNPERTLIQHFAQRNHLKLATLVVDAMLADDRGDEAKAGVGGVDTHDIE